MQGDADIIEVLNEALTAELTAINQYFIHHKMCENWDYEKLSKKGSSGEFVGEIGSARGVGVASAPRLVNAHRASSTPFRPFG